MTLFLAKRLGVSERELGRIQKQVGPLKEVAEFFKEAIEALEKSGAAEAVAHVVPWLGLATHAAMQAMPPVVFLVKLLAKVTEELEPDGLAYVAVTLAYERSVEQAIANLGAPKKKAKEVTGDMKRAFDAMKPQDFDLETMTFERAFEHPFMVEADGFLDVFAQAAGYDRAERRRLTLDVHSRFVVNLKTLLSHGKTRERFLPFSERLKLGSAESAAEEALSDHAELQRRQFEELPVLGSEAFPLADVYVDLDCGKLAWREMRDAAHAMRSEGRPRAALDPFEEANGGRHALLETVMSLIGDGDFRDAIVIQGVAGAGKSAFTLRLAAELLREGLRPIRVRMRDLQFDRHAGEAIRQAVKVSADDKPRHPPEDLFLRGAIFDEEVSFRGARVCPYVLILDGWDEISVSAVEGFRVRLDRMLEQVRAEYLSNRETPVRVVVTGRPAAALTEGSFLRDETVVLTMRPFRPEQLDEFISRLAAALEKTPEGREKWTIPDPKRFKPVQKKYAKEFAARAHGDATDTRTMEVLGLPLLAHVALRVMSSHQGELAELVENPTVLYRNLVDLTCERAGQLGRQALDPAARQRLTGDKLRQLLRKTAAAITVHGQESIGYEELARRLKLDPDALEARAEEASSDNVLTALMISFYFKGGHRDLGCEFVHKSFREYLFAEAIVAALEEHGRRAEPNAPERRPYWREIEEGDARAIFFRALGELLAPQWLAPDVVRHVEQLVAQEIARAKAKEEGALDVARWELVRDALADLWDAWGEGVHMRPQPKKRGRGGVELDRTMADELVDWSAPQAAAWGDASLAPARTVTIDAHLGDGIFRLAALVHFEIARARGLFDRGGAPEAAWSGAGDAGKGARRYQTVIEQKRARFVVFAPSGDNADWFANYVMRVNAAGWRPGGPFPLGVSARGVDLRGATFSVPIPQSPPRATSFAGANLSGASAVGACLFAASFAGALMKETLLDRAELAACDLRGANLEGASLVRADLHGADLRNAKLARADLTATNLRNAKLVGASLDGAELSGADTRGAEMDPPRGSKR